jgi:hypothetical protein
MGRAKTGGAPGCELRLQAPPSWLLAWEAAWTRQPRTQQRGRQRRMVHAVEYALGRANTQLAVSTFFSKTQRCARAAAALRSHRPTGDGGSGAQHVPFHCANDYRRLLPGGAPWQPGRAAGWSGLSSCVQPLAAPQCGYPPSSTRCAGDHAAWLVYGDVLCSRSQEFRSSLDP